jgi:hypothetical protein
VIGGPGRFAARAGSADGLRADERAIVIVIDRRQAIIIALPIVRMDRIPARAALIA